MTSTLRNGEVVEDRRLDRLVHFDERSRSYPVSATFTSRQHRRMRSYTWRCRDVLDQGTEGRCVEYAISHALLARPVEIDSLTVFSSVRDADVYHAAQHLDDWDGCYRGSSCAVSPFPASYEGTSILAGMKAATDAGLFREYRWCFGLQDLITAVGYKGPVVLGVPWYEGCRDPDGDGFLHPSGAQIGGHALLVVGVDVKRQTFTLHNSWGPSWGERGRAKLSWTDMDRMLEEAGEAVIPVKRPLTKS